MVRRANFLYTWQSKFFDKNISLKNSVTDVYLHWSMRNRPLVDGFTIPNSHISNLPVPGKEGRGTCELRHLHSNFQRTISQTPPRERLQLDQSVVLNRTRTWPPRAVGHLVQWKRVWTNPSITRTEFQPRSSPEAHRVSSVQSKQRGWDSRASPTGQVATPTRTVKGHGSYRPHFDSRVMKFCNRTSLHTIYYIYHSTWQ